MIMIIPFFILFIVPILVLAARLVLICFPRLWRETTGEVIDFKIASRTYPSKFPDLIDDAVIKFLRAKYRYSVGNKIYSSKRVSLDIFDRLYTNDEIETDELLNSVKNKSVKVYYMGHFPTISVLTTPFQKGRDHIAVIIVLTVLMGIVYLIFSISEHSYPKKPTSINTSANQVGAHRR